MLRVHCLSRANSRANSRRSLLFALGLGVAGGVLVCLCVVVAAPIIAPLCRGSKPSDGAKKPTTQQPGKGKAAPGPMSKIQDTFKKAGQKIGVVNGRALLGLGGGLMVRCRLR